MASLPHSVCFHPLKPTNYGVSTSKTNPRNFILKTQKVSSSLGPSNAESSSPNPLNTPEKSSEAEPGDKDPVKLAFARAKEYKKSIQLNPTPRIVQNPVPESAQTGKNYDGLASEGTNDGNQEVPNAVKLAMDKAREYKKNKGAVGSDRSVVESETISELKRGNASNLGNGLFEMKVSKKEELTISSIDFMGLDFEDKKKSRGLPAGLVRVADPFPEGDLPEVEIIVGDASKFGDAAASKPKRIQEDNSDLYKPTVSTWGVFPRPSNISKTYGGGRVIRPGEVLETAEDKAAKEARTKQLLAAYKGKIGLNVDPKLKSECEKALKDGDSLMDLGKLKEALPLYEKVMDKLPFQSELHGLAALQWSICQDSLSRSTTMLCNGT